MIAACDVWAGRAVEVLFNGAWRPGTIRSVYDAGCDVIVGTAGCWYIPLDQIREP